jgi:hypothetical protein
MRGGAVELLKHLIEPVHRAAGIIVVGNTRSELERPVWQMVDVEDAGVDDMLGQAGGAALQQR